MQTRPEQYGGVISSTMKIVKEEGVSALWKGSVPTAGGMILENCMAFGINEALKRAFPDKPSEFDQDGPPNLLKPFLMGYFTGCCSATVLLPSEIIKAKTQVEIGSTSSSEVIRTMMKRQGIRSMFVGMYGVSFDLCQVQSCSNPSQCMNISSHLAFLTEIQALTLNLCAMVHFMRSFLEVGQTQLRVHPALFLSRQAHSSAKTYSLSSS
jgi:hypothetical protein